MARKKKTDHGEARVDLPSEVPAHVDPVLPGVNPAAADQESPSDQSVPFHVVCIGASAGGLEAFKHFLETLPPDTGMAFVVVAHLSPEHQSMLAEILQRSTRMPVTQVENNDRVRPDHVYVIPPGKSLVMSDKLLQLSPRVEVRGLHHPIDIFMRSLAEEQGHKAIGVILSGTANDGTLGMEEIQAAGGITFAQDDTAEQTSMPRSVMAAGCADFVLAPADIAKEIARIARHPYVQPDVGDLEFPRKDPAILRILDLLRKASGVDFAHYKYNTLQRRITRRMVLHKLDNLSEYIRMLATEGKEVEALYQDILIGVTSFFRNPESHEALKKLVFPALVAEASGHEQLRAWALGCSTGEEAYSLAMTFTEFIESTGKRVSLQIFATDLNSHGIEKARYGLYSKGITQDVSPERLRRFFVEVDGSYRISKPIRDMCIFARQNMLADPPFSRLDLVACRNVMIYLEPVLQRKLVPILHYSLRNRGYLWLGSSETIGQHRELFDLMDAKHKFYVRKAAVRATLPLPLTTVRLPTLPQGVPAQPRDAIEALVDTQKEVDRQILSRYAPAGVVLDGALEIIQFRGDTSPYLAPAPGKPTLSLLKMLREGLMVSVRGAIHRAKREGHEVREEGLHVTSGGAIREVDIVAVPLVGGELPSGTVLLLFEESEQSIAARARQIEAQAIARATSSTASIRGASDEAEFQRLKQELSATREYLQSVIEQHEAANEELQSANEEVQSANEELQSINEEIETSKEEIQSSNEELATVNDELQTRNIELSQSNNDLLNLLSSVQMAIVMLGPEMRVRRFTPAAERLFNLSSSDIGRPIRDIKLDPDLDDLEALVVAAMDTVNVQEREIQNKSGQWFSLRVRPYRTFENKIDGAVLIMIDIDTLKRSEQALRESESRFEVLADSAPVLIWVNGLEGCQTVNRAYEDFLGLPESSIQGFEWTKHIHPDDRGGFMGTYLEAFSRHTGFNAQFRFRRHDGVYRWMRCVATPRIQGNGEFTGFVGCTFDISDLKEAEHMLRDEDRRKDEFLATLSHELRNPLASLCSVSHLLSTDKNVPTALVKAHEVIERQTRNMVRLVDDLLDITRVTHGTIQLRKERVDLTTPLESAISATDHLRTELHQELQFTKPKLPMRVSGDPTRLEQIFVNLLTNAAKFTPIRGHVWVKIERDDSVPLEPMVAVRIRDDGEGISPSSLPHIFDLFVQGSRSLGTIQAGVGIGLTLAKRLAQMHGGSIEATSSGLALGSEFIVRLPMVPAAAEAPSESVGKSSKADDVAPRRILVVDDNVDAAETQGMILRASGHVVRVAHDGSSALELARSFLPEVVLLDIGMPGEDGYSVARKLRAEPGLADALIVALTGFGREADVRKSRDAGFDLHLTKPVEQQRIQMILANGKR